MEHKHPYQKRKSNHIGDDTGDDKGQRTDNQQCPLPDQQLPIVEEALLPAGQAIHAHQGGQGRPEDVIPCPLPEQGFVVDEEIWEDKGADGQTEGPCARLCGAAPGNTGPRVRGQRHRGRDDGDTAKIEDEQMGGQP